MSTAPQINGPLNKTRLGEAVAAELGTSHDGGDKAVEAVLNVIARTVASGHAVTIPNFGTWQPVQAAERQAHNPQTGEAMTVPAHQALRFRPSPHLRKAVRDGDTTIHILKRPSGRSI